MADNYMQFSFDIDFPHGGASVSAGAIGLLLSTKAAWGIGTEDGAAADMGFAQAFPDAESQAGRERSEALALSLFRALCEAQVDILFDYAGKVPEYLGIDLDCSGADDNCLGLSSQAAGDVEATGVLTSALIQAFDLNPVGFEYAMTCSRPRPGEFGGGAVFCTADGQEMFSGYEWLAEQEKAVAELAAAADAAPGEPGA